MPPLYAGNTTLSGRAVSSRGVRQLEGGERAALSGEAVFCTQAPASLCGGPVTSKAHKG